MKYKPHAILDQYEIVTCGEYEVAKGIIYCDTKGRFPDGKIVRTSVIMMREGDYIQTRNTQYMLGNPYNTQELNRDELYVKFMDHW